MNWNAPPFVVCSKGKQWHKEPWFFVDAYAEDQPRGKDGKLQMIMIELQYEGNFPLQWEKQPNVLGDQSNYVMLFAPKIITPKFKVSPDALLPYMPHLDIWYSLFSPVGSTESDGVP